MVKSRGILFLLFTIIVFLGIVSFLSANVSAWGCDTNADCVKYESNNYDTYCLSDNAVGSFCDGGSCVVTYEDKLCQDNSLVTNTYTAREGDVGVVCESSSSSSIDCSSEGDAQCGIGYCDNSGGFPQCSFEINETTDTEGPVTSDLVVDKVVNACNIKISALETDLCSNIEEAEYFIGGSKADCNSAEWGTGNGFLDAVDGSYDELVEAVMKNNAGNNLHDSSLNVHVRGKDVFGNIGACETVNIALDCLPPDYPTCQIGNDVYNEAFGNGIVVNGECNPNELLVCGNNPTIEANICDKQSTIQLAEYFIDESSPADWEGIPMNVSDGQYLDEICEDVNATVDLSELVDGTHYIQLHGKDSQETWGKLDQPANPLVSFIKDTTPPKTEKSIDFSGGEENYVRCDTGDFYYPDEVNPEDVQNGCYYVRSGTNITLSAFDFNPDDDTNGGYNDLLGQYAGDVTIRWRIYYSDDCTLENPDWVVQSEGDGKLNEDVQLNLTEDSCHLIEYWSTDGFCGNMEKHHYELDIVDNLPPETSKEVGEPKVPLDGGVCEPQDGQQQLPLVLNNAISPGDNLTTISGAYSQGSCSINTGIAFDGSNLIISCWNYNVLDFLNPADGSLDRSLTVPGYSGLYANAWDATRNKLWQCADNDEILLVDTSDGSSILHTGNNGIDCVDGLAYDGSDDTLWISPDVSSTVYHYKINNNQTLTLLNSYPVGGLLGGIGNSGIAVGGSNLYLANNGGSQIYETPKDLSTSTLFATGITRLEDMECDDVTFSSQGVGAIWSMDAYDRQITAYAIPQGQCGFGGLPPEPQCDSGDYYITQQTPIELSCSDKNPHPVGGEQLYYRYRYNEDCNNLDESQWTEFQPYEETIYFEQDSCHELQWYCEDALGNKEDVQSEIDVVDTQPPEIQKEIVGPHYGDCLPEPGSKDVCFLDGVTNISVSVIDPQPHPVDDVSCSWSYTVDGGDSIVGGESLGDSFMVHFPEESHHILTIVCEDALGNTVRDVEDFYVDKTPPETTKTYGEPFFSDGINYKVGSFVTSGTGVSEYSNGNAHLYAPLITDYPPANEGTVHIDLDGMGLSDLNSLSWDANVTEGYLPHADVYLSNGEVLVFEYAKADSANCDNAPYPTGVLNTFDDKGIIDDSTYAWLNSGPAGPCGDPAFDNNHKSLAGWKTEYSGVNVTAINVEVDGWISTSEAYVHSITLNGDVVIIDPNFDEEGVHWINSSTPITLSATDEIGPHVSGVQYTKYRITQVDDDYCWDQNLCQSAVGDGDWNTYGGEFTVPEQSCHLIEYYSVDNVDKTETVKKQCAFVDNTAPDTDKEIGTPSYSCQDGEGKCGPETEWRPFYVNSSTEITLSCEDGLPHPVDHSELCFAVSWHGTEYDPEKFEYITPSYAEKYDGHWQTVDDTRYWCVNTENEEFAFNFQEDSLHNLEWFCQDALGNRGDLNVEYDNVDNQPPEIIVHNPTLDEAANVTRCTQSIVAEVRDLKSGVNESNVYAELVDESGSTVEHVQLFKSEYGTWEGLMGKEHPVGDYKLKVCASDNLGNEYCKEIDEYLPEMVTVNFIDPSVCEIDPETGGSCDFTFNLCMRDGNSIQFWMNKLGIGGITPDMMNATTSSDVPDNALVGLKHPEPQYTNQGDCESAETFVGEYVWEEGVCYWQSNAEMLSLELDPICHINGKDAFNLHLDVDSQAASEIGTGVHDLEYWIKTSVQPAGCGLV